MDCQFITGGYRRYFVRKNVSERLDLARARRPSSSGSRRLNDTFIIVRAFAPRYISLFPAYSYSPCRFSFFLQATVVFVVDNSHGRAIILVYIVIYTF